ncbi:extracellular solute-binding protein [Paenibacillus crassostreae]|uniref:ABC transporter substrate-binding protein n=1 Tax=Paenibacillus crassostreae TaxID=1763538 RepID=A0A167B7Z1_9BACL|nr:extracellular solute-binding protein [Paenibacillus crassostreae]AOZ93095.1 ABC transporter substrate-binding protein [Paenibacillus crassostreae]OAB71816.1 ABC transporter substrate-binding protein [Paenibacillus crassostreae]
MFITYWSKRSIYIFSLLMFSIILISACSNEDGSSQTSSKEDGRSSISIMAPLHFPHPPTNDIIQRIEELTDTKLEIGWVPEGIYTDKMNTALTTNSLKKVTFVKFTDYTLVKNEIRSKAFWEIGPYLKEFPHLQNLNSVYLEQSAVDQKIYGLYTERPSSRQGIIIREDWLDNLQLNKPKTIEELYEVMRQFTYNDPDQNGSHDTIGLVDRNDLVYGVFKTLSSYFGTPNNWKMENNQFIPEFETAEYMNTMNFMKRLYNEKILNQDFALTSKEVQRDKIIRGTAGVYIGSMTDVQRLSNEVKDINPEARLGLINRIEGPYGYKVWSIPNYNGLYVFSKKAIKTEEELKTILGFFDRTMDHDVVNLMMYGFEGKHYEMKDNLVILPEETSQLRVNEVNPLYTLIIAGLSNPNIMEVGEKESMTALADQLSKDNELFLVDDPTIHLSSQTYDEKNLELSIIIADATYNYILGNLTVEGFKQEIKRWKRNGGEMIIQEYNATLE